MSELKGNILKDIYNHLRKNFIVIGLTGGLGAGSSTTAKTIEELLNDFQSTIKFLEGIEKADEIKEIDNLEYYRARRIRLFLSGIKEPPKVRVIKVRHLLWLFLLKILTDEKLESNFKKHLEDQKVEINLDYNKLIEELESLLLKDKTTFHIFNQNFQEKANIENIKALIDKNIESNINSLNNAPPHIRVRLLQEVGRFLRSAKTNIHIFENINLPPPFNIAELIRRVIKILHRNNKGNLFVIDAIRNNYEIEFFRNRYSNFYLFSILAEKTKRIERLCDMMKEERPKIEELLKVEEKEPSSADEIGCVNNFV